MNKKNAGRPVDLSGINIQELYDWLNTNKLTRKILICQSIIALHQGAKMEEVCNVMNITREGVRLWKNQLRQQGLKGLRRGKVGKRSKLNQQLRSKIKKILKRPPSAQGYENKKWTGLIMQDYIKKKWDIDISLRTAQLWLSKVK